MSLDLIKSLETVFSKNELSPVLVGGWAVQHHGFARSTLDIDFVLCSDDKERVTQLLESIGYNQSNAGTMATRFEFKDPWEPMLDIIWVNRATYAEMHKNSTIHTEAAAVHVISLRNLLAMKLHAMHNNEERLGKDLLDIRKLLQYNRTKISDEELLQLCKKYGPSEAYHTITHP